MCLYVFSVCVCVYVCCVTPSCTFLYHTSVCKCVCVCLCQVEPVGPGHRASVSDGHHPGGDRDQRRPAHQPHHHQDHESTEDSTRYTPPMCEVLTRTHTLTRLHYRFSPTGVLKYEIMVI